MNDFKQRWCECFYENDLSFIRDIQTSRHQLFQIHGTAQQVPAFVRHTTITVKERFNEGTAADAE